MNTSIQKAFKILSYIAANPHKMSLSEMSRALDLNKTTLYRFLQTLEALNLVEKRDGCCVPGIKLFELGSQVPVKQLIIEKASSILIELAHEVNETVNLGELNGNRILYLHKCESTRSLQLQANVGSYIPLHTSALGKAVLSSLSESERDAVISRLVLEPKTADTICDRRQLKTHIEEVAKKGYALDLAELEIGLHCVAVPLAIPGLKFFGAISFSGPSVRFTWVKLEELAGRLKEAAARIKKAITPGEQP